MTLHAIVLRRTDTGESDRRLTLLTRESGKLDATAKGARKGGSRLAGSSDPLSVALLEIAEGKRNRFITQAQPVSSFRGLRTDYERLTFALALCELYAAVLPVEQPVPEAYDLLLESLKHLESHPKPLPVLVWAELKLLEISGFMPQFECCVVSGGQIEAEPLVSPAAGGYVCASSSGPFHDRFRTRVEVLYGLIKTQVLEEPPPNLRLADDALRVLIRFWRHYAEAPLPANDVVLSGLPRPA
jgi:DNA repair protein RecO (recombination protein O)